MSHERKIWRVIAAAVSLACAVALGGCQRQAQPSGSLTPPDAGESLSESAEPVSSLTEPAPSQPVSSTDSGASPQPLPSESLPDVVSSETAAPSSSQASSQPSSSQEADSESQALSIPFTLLEYHHSTFAYFSDSGYQLVYPTQIITEPSGLENLDIQNKELYDDAYFHDHALVYLAISYYNNGPRERVNGLIPSGQQLIVDYTSFYPMIFGEATSSNTILLEVGKSDMEGITQIVLQSNEIHWMIEQPEPEGWDPWEYTNSFSGTNAS